MSWPNGPHGNPYQKTQTVPKTVSCSPQPDSKPPLLKATLIQITECEDVRLVPIGLGHPSVFSTERHAACSRKRNINSKLDTSLSVEGGLLLVR